jgi:hypothetical protein
MTAGLRFELPPVETLRFTHEMTIPIRWGDLDAMGHVNNTLYFRYFEIVRLQWFYDVGGPPRPDGEGPVIVNAFCNFLQQVDFPGRAVGPSLRGEPRPQQLRHLHDAGAHRRPRGARGRRRRPHRVDRWPRAQVGAAARLAAPADHLNLCS